MALTPTLTLTDAAKRFGVSRQRVHEWLQDTGRLARCERVRHAGRVLLIKIPLPLLQDAPFVTGRPAGRPKKSA